MLPLNTWLLTLFVSLPSLFPLIHLPVSSHFPTSISSTLFYDQAMTAEIASNKHRIETLSNENEMLKKTSNADARVVLLTSEVDKLKVDNKNLEESLKRARARVEDPSTPQGTNKDRHNVHPSLTYCPSFLLTRPSS